VSDATLVTVAIPTHDRAAWLADSLESAVALRWPALEILVADDGGTAATAKVVERFASDPRVRVLRWDAQGIAANHRRAAEVARGEWIVFLADDDRIGPDFVANRMRSVAGDPDAAVVFSGYRQCDEDLRPVRVVDPALRVDSPLDARALVQAALARHWSINGSLYRRDTLLEAWPDEAEVGAAFDFALHLRLALLPGTRGYYGSWCDLDYRMHSGQTSRGDAEMRHFAATSAAYGYVLRHAMPRDVRALVRRDFASWQVLWARAHARHGRMDEARRMLRHAIAVGPRTSAAWSQAVIAHLAPWRLRGQS
jgi:glycosyltransferase involved in cell wall biosynthesis